MCLLFETICIIDGQPIDLPYHQARLDQTRRDLLGYADPIDLHSVFKRFCFPNSGKLKCRIPYEKEFGKPEWAPYVPKKIVRLAFSEIGNYSYAYKFSDRSFFDKQLCKYPGFDELIFTRDGEVTDSTYTNLAFFDGEHWFTPQHPLLQGTKRARYILEGVIHPRVIKQSDLPQFTKVSLINAMLNLGDLAIDSRNVFDGRL